MSRMERSEAQRELLEDVLKRVHETWYEPESDQDRERREQKERKRQAVERALRVRQAILRRDIDKLSAALRREADQRQFLRVACFLDHALDAAQADEVIGDLFEQYIRRLRARKSYMKSWLWSQASWIVLNRGIELLGRVRKAWAGK